MKLLYISGHYGDHDKIHGVDHNINEASKVALLAWRAGWAVICPHKNTAGFHHADDIAWSTWMAGDIAILRHCDAILMLPGWQTSPGSVMEWKIARTAGLKILEFSGSVPKPSEVIR